MAERLVSPRASAQPLHALTTLANPRPPCASRPDAHGAHVLGDRLAEPHSGVETFGDDVGETSYARSQAGKPRRLGRGRVWHGSYSRVRRKDKRAAIKSALEAIAAALAKLDDDGDDDGDFGSLSLHRSLSRRSGLQKAYAGLGWQTGICARLGRRKNPVR